MFSGEQIFMNGKSEFLAICAARDVLPLPGGPEMTKHKKHKQSTIGITAQYP